MKDTPPDALHKPGYVLEWHDEFDGAELDTSKWQPAYLPHWSSRQRAAPRYVLRDNTLVLQITADQQPWCPEFDGAIRVSSLQTGQFSGPLGSQQGQHRFNQRVVVREEQPNVRLYTPQYGYFECRAKALATPGFMAALWMIGYEDAPERSGEICMFEIFGKDVTADTAKVGMGVHPFGDPALTDDFSQPALAIDQTEFHVYAHEWTPTHVDFYVDGQHIKRVNQSPTYPIQFMLSLYAFPEAAADAFYPQEFVVDYVRVYQPEGGY